MAYQYVTVLLPWVQAPQSKEHAWTERINAVAAEGWRLVAINDEVLKSNTTRSYATFEREVDS